MAATKNFVFVRDSKETNVRVFDRKAVLLTAVNNNTVFAKLGTGSDLLVAVQNRMVNPMTWRSSVTHCMPSFLAREQSTHGIYMR